MLEGHSTKLVVLGDISVPQDTKEIQDDERENMYKNEHNPPPLEGSLENSFSSLHSFIT